MLWRNLFYSAVFFGLAVQVAQGGTLVRPRDIGEIEIPITNDNASILPGEAVEITISVKPAQFAPHFIVDGQNSDLGPSLIIPGETRSFLLKYSIAADVPDGVFEANLNLTMNKPNEIKPVTFPQFSIQPES